MDGRVFVGTPSRLVAYGLFSGLPAGDTDGDGRLTILDVRFSLLAAVGLLDLTPEQAAALDLDGNGRVDQEDVLSLLHRAFVQSG